MERRGFLLGSGASILHLLLPARAGAGQAMPPRMDGRAALEEAVAAARKRACPVLVLVIPEDEESRFERGRTLGAWIQHGEDLDLAPLAVCEVACAAMEDAKAVLGGSVLETASGDAWMVLVDPLGQPMRVQPIECPGIPSLLHLRLDCRAGESFGEFESRCEERMLARVRHLSARLGRALRAIMTDAMDSAAIARLSAEEHRLLRTADPAQIEDEILARGTAVLWKRVLERPGLGFATLIGLPPGDPAAALARLARTRLGDQPPRGAAWARSTGCGAPQSAKPCGIGHVTPLAERFLWFYAGSGGR